MLENLNAYYFNNDINLCDFGTCFDVSSAALTPGTLDPQIEQIRDGGYTPPPDSSIYTPVEMSGEDSLVFSAYVSEGSTVSVDLSTTSTCVNVATGYDMFNFGYQLLIIEKDIVLDRVEGFNYLDTYTFNTTCGASLISNWEIIDNGVTYSKVLSGAGIDILPVGSYENIDIPGDIVTVKYFVPMPDKYTYVGFGGSTGAFTDEHWIHDFLWESEFNTVTMADILGNSNLLGSAERIGNSIRLTPAENEKVGNFFYNAPMFISDNRGRLVDWSAYFVTSIGGGSRGDGLSFILHSTNNGQGTTGGSVGYGGIKNSIGILYDTYCNIEIGEPNNNNVKLCVQANVRYPLLVQTDPGLDIRGETVNDYRYNWIVYSGKTKILNVFISSTPIKPAEPIMSFFIDIRSDVVAN